MKKINKLIIPFVLLILWGYLTILYIFNYNLSLSVISYPHNKNNFANFNTNRLFEGQKIRGSFIADENYLGIVTVSFATLGNKPAYLDEDTIVFRIKELGASNWYYEKAYKSGLMYEVPFYPFGFPKIIDSKGKNYVLEIESLNGNNFNAIALNRWDPVMVSRYQIPKNELLQDRTKLINFFGRKILVAFGSMDVLYFSFVYFLPILFYFLMFVYPFKKVFIPVIGFIFKMFVYPFKKVFIPVIGFIFKRFFWLVEISLGRLFKNMLQRLRLLSSFRRLVQTPMRGKLSRISEFLIHSLNSLGRWGVSFRDSSMKHLDFILILVIFIDIFFIPAVNDIAFIIVVVLWAMLAKRYGYVSKQSFIVGFIFLGLCPLILLFKLENIAEKSGAWAYMFFVAGVIQILKENKSSKSHEEN